MEMGIDLILKNVSKSLKGKTILNNISLIARAGEIVAIVGPSGSGKSTTLRLINRLQEVDSGEILLDGKSIRSMKPTELRHLIGFISQIPVMFDCTVLQNVMYGLTMGANPAVRTSQDLIEKATKFLQMADLDISFSDKDASKLSVGEQQRVAIARALMLSPEILLMDEPTAALDPVAIDHIESTIKKINRTTGTTFVIVTHSPDQAVRLGQRIFWLHEGGLKEVSKNDIENLMRGVWKEGSKDA